MIYCQNALKFDFEFSMAGTQLILEILEFFFIFWNFRKFQIK